MRGATIDLDRDVTAVRSSPSDNSAITVQFETETITADAVVVAMDPPTARSLTGIDAIPTTGRGCVTQYFAAPASFDIGKRLHLKPLGSVPNHAVQLSAVAPEFAPDGRQLLSATVLDSSGEDSSTMETGIRATLRDWYPDQSCAGLRHLHTDRVEFAQFDQPPGIHAQLPKADAPTGRVALAGDYTRWSSIQGALSRGVWPLGYSFATSDAVWVGPPPRWPNRLEHVCEQL